MYNQGIKRYNQGIKRYNWGIKRYNQVYLGIMSRPKNALHIGERILIFVYCHFVNPVVCLQLGF